MLKKIDKIKKMYQILFFLFVLLFPISNSLAHDGMNNSESNEIWMTSENDYFHAQFRLELGSSRFYLTSMEQGDIWFLNLTTVYKGTFYIYLFDERPRDNFIRNDDSIVDPMIKEVAQAYNETPANVWNPDLEIYVKNVQLNYTAKATKLHYIEIILIDNGPDTFYLDSSQEIDSYFIPFISGYPIQSIVSMKIITIFVIYFKLKKSKQKQKQN